MYMYMYFWACCFIYLCMSFNQPARVADGCHRVQLSGDALVPALEVRRRHQDNGCQVCDKASAKLHRTFILRSLKLSCLWTFA